MSNVIDDRRGLIFTINGEPHPVYQVESSAWAHTENMWAVQDMPQAIRDQIQYLRQSGSPGAFVQLVQGEVGVYVIMEPNIGRLPAPASDDGFVADPSETSGTRTLAPYDIVICAKSGVVQGENGETIQTQEGDCYVLKCQSWGQFFLPPLQEPAFVTTTKNFLLLLEQLHSKNFLSMWPDPDVERLPSDFGTATPAIMPINCYVLNLSNFKR